MTCVVEFFVEPFSEGRPGSHVKAAVDAMEQWGFTVEIGPFGNRAEGDSEKLPAAVADMLENALGAGATRVSLQVITNDGTGLGLHLDSLHVALERLITQVEQELGAPLAKLPRESKQEAVRLLDERGAFLLRKSIEEVADSMGVSRITIYNYLNALEQG